MEVVGETAFFLARGADQRGEFGLEERLLAGARVEHDDQEDGIFRQFGDF